MIFYYPIQACLFFVVSLIIPLASPFLKLFFPETKLLHSLILINWIYLSLEDTLYISQLWVLYFIS